MGEILLAYRKQAILNIFNKFSRTVVIILDKIFVKLFLIIDLNCIFAVHKNENQSLC